MTHPLPTRLTFLSHLHTFEAGEKVRFLGCVTNYNTKTATLTLRHNYNYNYNPSPPSSNLDNPNSSLNPNNTSNNPDNPSITKQETKTETKKALIDANLLTSTLTATDTQIGEWVYVIGYITSSGQNVSDLNLGGGGGDVYGSGKWRSGELEVGVQALVLWSARDIKLDEYERVVGERLRMG